VQVPHDLVAVQQAGFDGAMRWRLSVRASFNAHFARGLRVVRFARAQGGAYPYYVLDASR